MKIYQRHTIRLKDYDYRHDGAYFLTICAYQHRCIFGEIKEEVVNLTDLGRVVETSWNAIPQHFPHVELDSSVVMPNHFHGILVITDNRYIPTVDNVGAQYIAPSVLAGSLGSIVRSFKAAVSRDFHRTTATKSPVWQRNYYEHIIRNEKSLNYIRYYVGTNPERWAEDVLRDEVSAQKWYSRFAKSQ